MGEGVTFDETMEDMKEEIYDDVCQEFHYILELPITGDQKQEIISDIVDYVFRERQKQPICECDAYDNTN